MICINLFGGAGIGKSTTASDIFSELKKMGVRTELVGEYAKELVYQKSTHLLDDQLFIFANQAHRLRNFARYGVQVAVCDSPLLLSIAYKKICYETPSFSQLVREEFERYQNINYLLIRDDSFWKMDGRVGDLSHAKFMDGVIARILGEYPHKEMSPDHVVEDVLSSYLEMVA